MAEPMFIHDAIQSYNVYLKLFSIICNNSKNNIDLLKEISLLFVKILRDNYKYYSWNGDEKKLANDGIDNIELIKE